MLSYALSDVVTCGYNYIKSIYTWGVAAKRVLTHIFQEEASKLTRAISVLLIKNSGHCNCIMD